ncbi:MAG: HD domain-containing phosphohydrolase [Planctomycetota bacterium]|nr:HD domain-containing phosphohydrolase [Planctomycetota bacterium]
MRLFEPILRKGRVMLPGGRALSSDDIGALRCRYPERAVRIEDPVLDELVAFEDDSHERTVARVVRRLIASALDVIRPGLAAREDGRPLNLRPLKRAVREAMAYLRDNPVTTALPGRDPDRPNALSEHIGNVFYLSLVLGITARDFVASERRKHTAARDLSPRIAYGLRSMGLGVAFMDLGMFALEHLARREEPLTEAQCQAVLEHPLASLQMLPEKTDPTTRMIVRSHHENYDGSGYPIGIGPERLHVLSRIVRIADSYDAATSRHVYREAKSPARALWEMSVGPYRRFYDPHLMSIFARLVQPFPIGTKLRLSDGRYAVLVRYNRRHPFNPSLLTAFDRDGRRLPESELDGPYRLDRRPHLRLASCAGEDLSFIYDPEPDLEGVPVRETFHSLYESVVP